MVDGGETRVKRYGCGFFGVSDFRILGSILREWLSLIFKLECEDFEVSDGSVWVVREFTLGIEDYVMERVMTFGGVKFRE